MLDFPLDLRLGMLISVMLIKKACTPLSVIILLILNINLEINEEHKLDIYKSSKKLILNFAIIRKSNIVNKLKKPKDLQWLGAWFIKDGMDNQSVKNHGILIIQNL